jgi:hypothetical protein
MFQAAFTVVHELPDLAVREQQHLDWAEDVGMTKYILDAAGGLCCLNDILGRSASDVAVDSIQDDAASLAMNQSNFFADDAFTGKLLDDMVE